MPVGERRYSTFISYSHEDERWARWLQRTIEHYRVPARLRGVAGAHGPVPETLRPVFRDREELASAADLSETIRQRLSYARSLVVICSPAAARSRWVSAEILEYKRAFGADRIFSLIVAGEPNSGDERECFPPALRFTVDASGELTDQPTEGIAADLRSGKDGKPLARLKILAGLLGVELDALRQREQQRRLRVLAGISAASMAGMALTGWLAWSAMVARDDAQRRQGQAEDLIEFMLTDLHAELQAVGRIDALGAAAGKARDYFATLAPRDMTEAALRSSGRALRQLGDIYRTQFQWDRALESFRDALTLDLELLARSPGDAELLFNAGQSEFWVGYVAFERNDYALALEHFSRYLEISRELYERDEGRLEWVMELYYAHTNMAGVFEARSAFDDALAHMHRAVTLNREAIAISPDDPGLLRDLSDSLAWLGTIQRGAGQLQASLESRRASRQELDELLIQDPDNASLLDLAAYAWRGEGFALSLVGRGAESIAAYREALARFDHLVELDPGNLRWARDRLESLSSLLQAADAADMDALPEDQRLMEMLTELETASGMADLDSAQRRIDLAAARLIAALRNPESAPQWRDEQLRLALTQSKTLYRENPEDAGILTARAHILLAAAEAGVAVEETALQEMLTTLAAHAAVTSDPLILAITADYALRFWDTARTRPLIERLHAIGYGSARFARECREAGMC